MIFLFNFLFYYFPILLLCIHIYIDRKYNEIIYFKCVYCYYFITMQVAVYGCSAMLLSLLQPPSSGSLSVPCVSTTMCMVALLYATVPLTTTFFWFSISSLCVHYNVHGCSAICYCPSYNHLLLVLYVCGCYKYHHLLNFNIINALLIS